MAEVTINVESAAIQEKLNQLSGKLKNLQPIMAEIGLDIRENIVLCFYQSRDPYGNEWEALSDKTIARRRNNSTKPLLDTGRLVGSMTYQATKNSVEIGSNVIYAKTQNFGRGKIPARPFMPDTNLPTDWEQDILDNLKHWLSL